jgi:hypothetical protein
MIQQQEKQKKKRTVKETRKLLEKFFREIFELKLDLSGIKFPHKDGFDLYMAVPPELEVAQIMASIRERFNVRSFYESEEFESIISKIDAAKEQKRPDGPYVFAYRADHNSDYVHRRKSYNQVLSENIMFANLKEYLLMSAFYKYLGREYGSFDFGVFLNTDSKAIVSTVLKDGSVIAGFYHCKWEYISFEKVSADRQPDWGIHRGGVYETAL